MVLLGIAIYLLIKLCEKLRGRPLKKIKEIRLLLISVVLVLCLAELVFVLTGFMSTYAEKRNVFYYNSLYETQNNYRSQNKNRYHTWSEDHTLETEEYSYFRKTNSENLSDKEHTLMKKNNEYRIIGIGDSFTEGDGADADSTWLKFLERSLKSLPIAREPEFFNAGVCGSDICFEYVLLKDKLLKYQPDLVLLVVNASDLTDLFIRGGMERFQTDGTIRYKKPPWWEPIYAISHISRLFFSVLGYSEIFYNDKIGFCKNEKKILIDTILLFEKLAQENGFKLIVILNPTAEEIQTQKMVLKEIGEYLTKKTEPDVINLYSYYTETEKINSSNYSDFYWKYDGHHNARGYEVFAQGVEHELKKNGIIDSLLKP